MSMISKGGFTLPGEAGYEQLTLELARKQSVLRHQLSEAWQGADEYG